MQAKQHIQLNTTQSIQPLLAKFGIETADIMVESLVLDSREVAIHSAFIALKGHVRDGRDFIPQAVSLGAKVIIAECDTQQEHGQTSMREQSLIISPVISACCHVLSFPCKRNANHWSHGHQWQNIDRAID